MWLPEQKGKVDGGRHAKRNGSCSRVELSRTLDGSGYFGLTRKCTRKRDLHNYLIKMSVPACCSNRGAKEKLSRK